MLAKPEYFSPPNEVCCWRGAVKTGQAPRWSCWPGQVLAGVPRRSAIWKVLAGVPRRSAIWKMMGGAPWRRAIWKMLAGVPRRSAIWKMMAGVPRRSAIWKRLAGRRGEEPSGSNCGRKCQCGSFGKRLLARPLWKSKAAIAEEQRRPVRPADGKYFRADCRRADGKCLVRRLPPAGIRIRRRFLPGS